MKDYHNLLYWLTPFFLYNLIYTNINEERLAIFYHQKRQYEQASYYYKQALIDNPHKNALLFNFSLVCNELGKFDQSQQLLETILQQHPAHKYAKKKLVLHYLRNKEWKKALPLLMVDDYWWYNEDISSQQIIIQHDGGLGDVIQFLRYAKRLHEAGAFIIMETPAALMPLLSRCSFIDQLILQGGPLPIADKQYIVSTPRLAYIMRDTLNNPSFDVPYLTADPELIAYWRKQLATDKQFKIGLCWQSSIMRDQTGTIIPNPRSISLAQFASLAQIPGLSFYSLQQINGTDQLSRLPQHFVIHEFGPHFDQQHGRFMDTAAVMKNLDLVITVDTSIAHLAGALGVPVWVLLPTMSDFRWFHDDTDSPWYPTMHLFRQQEYNHWEHVIQEIVHLLKNVLA
ncbi:MAG: tetratricopeptide repeat protein [Candidatus Babeliales bacterium]